MQQAAIDHIKALGFRVFMHDGNTGHKWLVYTDGTRLAVFGESRFGGYSVSTMHRPNRETGTGFSIFDGVDLGRITKPELERGFVMAPEWADSKQWASVKKYGDLTAFLKSDTWNARYVEI